MLQHHIFNGLSDISSFSQATDMGVDYSALVWLSVASTLILFMGPAAVGLYELFHRRPALVQEDQKERDIAA